MSSTIYVTVDTEPMAQSVERVGHHVDATSAAVVAMKVATVAAEQAAADKICDNVNRGFHSLLLSQISQKAAKAKSVVDAKFQEMYHLEASLYRIKNQMERDFHRISSRYHKLFKNINNTLRTRVHELDKDSVEVASIHMPQSIQRMMRAGVQAPVHQKESLSGAQFILSSIARNHTINVIACIQGMMNKTELLQESMKNILDKESVGDTKKTLLPAVLFEADDLNISIPYRKVFSNAENSQKNESFLMDSFERIKWQASKATADDIRQNVKTLLAKDKIPDRVRSKTLELLSNANWLQSRAGEL